MKLLISCTTILLAMYASVCASQSYAQAHPMMGMQLKMEYCMNVVRYANGPMEDIGCKIGRGDGKVGVKKDIVKQIVERMNMNQHSYEYKQLVSKEGLSIVFVDESLGSKGKATVWEDKSGNVSYEFEREE